MTWAWDAPDAGGPACPVLLMHEAAPLLESHRWMERGFLPASGGWREQEAWWIAAIDALAPGLSQAEQELRKPREVADGGE